MIDYWKSFRERYPNANLSKFGPDVILGKPNIFFFENGEEIAIFGDHENFHTNKYFSDSMKKELGIPIGFPLELILNTNPKFLIPAVPFDEKPHTIGDKLKNQEIYVTPSDKFHVTFRDILTKTKITHYSSSESRKWMAGPNMNYWPQQLNFALWCATTGCGVSSRLLFEDKMADGKTDVTDSELNLPTQVRAFLWFHVYFTVRRILFEMGGIQNVLALPNDPTFSQTDNKYDLPSYKRICNEFGIHPNTYFRFIKGANHGLGNVYVWFTNEGPVKTDYPYPGTSKFSDEGGEAKLGNLIQYVENTESAKQFEHQIIPVSNGLTSAGLSRINQSIEAFVYCILGSQVNVRSTILGNSGSAQEVRREFLVLLDSSIRKPDINKSVQRFQLAIQESKVKLDLAISPGTWLIPSKMVINTESTVGYNNKLKRASPTMSLGVNSDVNTALKPVGIKHNLSISKVKLPHAIESKHPKAKVDTKETEVVSVWKTKPPTSINTSHEINLAVLTIAAGGLAWFLFR